MMTEIEKPTTTDETSHFENLQFADEVAQTQHSLAPRSWILITGLILAAILLAAFGATTAFAAASDAAAVHETESASVIASEDGTVETIITIDGITAREITSDPTAYEAASLPEDLTAYSLDVRSTGASDTDGRAITEYSTDGGLTWSTEIPEGFSVEIGDSQVTISGGNRAIVGLDLE